MSRTPNVAIIGRQNVGKSTLANRMLGRRAAIAHGSPGVTRDRLELEATWRGRRFRIVDTAGFLHRARGVEALAIEQADRALADADVVLLVVDVRAGVTDEDGRLAGRLRRAAAPVVVVANKADADADEADAAIFHGLGLGEPVAVSALHGRGAGELLDRVVALLPERADEGDAGREPAFAIVGRPNVGKSSLFNRLVGAERVVVSDVPGTTRDAIDTVVRWPDQGPVRFVDTAGIRRGGRVRGVEYYGLLRSEAAIGRADVVVLVLAAPEGFTAEDKRIASRVMRAGRALAVAANKWDLVEERDPAFKRLVDDARPFARAPVLRTDALHGRGVPRVPPVLIDLARRWHVRAATSVVNEILQAAQAARPTPRSSGTLHYAAQVASGPPTFVVFGSGREPDAGYRRYLEHRLRDALGLDGVPIRIRFRSRGGRRRRPGR